jgi:hypothetical protein
MVYYYLKLEIENIKSKTPGFLTYKDVQHVISHQIGVGKNKAREYADNTSANYMLYKMLDYEIPE